MTWSIDQAAPRSAPPARTYQKVRLSWLHAATEDRHGNRFTVQYQHPAEAGQEGGFQEPLPTAIDYVFTAGAPTRRVLFSYQPRSEPASLRREFVAGLEFRRTRLLEGIEMQAPGAGGVQTVRHYRFAYQASPATRRPLLRTIEECDGNPRGATRAVSCKRPTTFSYDPGSSAFVERRQAAPDTRQPGLEKFWGFQTADISSTTPQIRAPVGEDQRQHLELCRDIALRFSATGADNFVVPKSLCSPRSGGSWMSFKKPTAKFQVGRVAARHCPVLDEPETVAVVQAGRHRHRHRRGVRPREAGVSNLLAIAPPAAGRRTWPAGTPSTARSRPTPPTR